MAKLIEAAVSLFAEVGVEAASVLEITSRAKVANGTFYNYFRDKDEVVRAVYESATDSLGRNIITRLDCLQSAPEQIALGTIWFVDAVSSEPLWGRMMMNAIEQPGSYREMCTQIIGGYIENGLEQGHFHVECTPVLLDLFLSVLVGAIRSRLERDKEGDIGLFAAEIHLRMLGVPPRRAYQIPRNALRDYGGSPIDQPPEARSGNYGRKRALGGTR